MKGRKLFVVPLFFSCIIVSFYWAGILEAFVRRGLVVLTLVTFLWAIYKLLDEQVLVVKMTITVSLIGVISLLFLILVLAKTGW